MIRQLTRLREALGTECTSTQVLALLIVAEYGKGDWLSVSALAELCKVSQHAASRAAKFLADLNLIEWEDGGKDGRQRILFLATAGEELLSRLHD